MVKDGVQTNWYILSKFLKDKDLPVVIIDIMITIIISCLLLDWSLYLIFLFLG